MKNIGMTILAALATASTLFGAEAPALRSRAEVEAVLAKAPKLPDDAKLRPLHIVLLADVKDHGPGAHDYPCWQERWTLLLGGQRAIKAWATKPWASKTPTGQVNMHGPAVDTPREELAAGLPNVEVSTAWQWPSPEQLRTADLIAMNCYRSGGVPRTWSDQRIGELEEFLERGGGFVAIHPATYTVRKLSEPAGQKVARLTGMGFDRSIKVRHGAMQLVLDTKHPFCLGLPKTIDLVDEPYWPPVGKLADVCVLATSEERLPPDSDKISPQPMFWTSSFGKGRIFACVPGHFNWTFDDPLFRILLLRGMAWAAGESPYRFDPLATRGVRLAK